MPDTGIPTPYCARVEAVFQVGTAVWTNRWYFDSVYLDWDGAMLADIAGAVGTWVIFKYLPLLSNQVQFLRVTANDQAASPINPITIPYIGYTGGIDSPSSPVSVISVVALYDQTPGLKGIGRTLVSGLPISVISENALDPVWRDNMFEAFVYLIDLPHGLYTAYLSYVSYRFNGAYRAQGEKHNIDHIVVRPDVSTRRLRRLNRYRPA